MIVQYLSIAVIFKPQISITSNNHGTKLCTYLGAERLMNNLRTMINSMTCLFMVLVRSYPREITLRIISIAVVMILNQQILSQELIGFDQNWKKGERSVLLILDQRPVLSDLSSLG